MSRKCELTGRSVQFGNNVSHANNKTRRRYLPNLAMVTLVSEALNRSFRLQVSSYGLRSLEHRGGLDPFLLKEKEVNLSKHARNIKKQLKMRLKQSS